MWLQRFTNYILTHYWQALALTFVSTFVPVIGVIGVLIAGLVTLMKGAKQGAPFMLASTLPFAIVLYLAGGFSAEPVFSEWAAFGVAVISNLLTWVFAAVLYRNASWSALIQVAALLGVLVISLVHVANPNVSDWWGSELNAYYAQAHETIKGLNPATDTDVASTETELQTQATINNTIEMTKHFATGAVVSTLLLCALMQLAVSRWWQAVIFHPGSLRRELRNIRLSQLAGTLFLISLLFSYIGNSVVEDMMPVLYLLFTVAGLSLVHYFFGMMRSPVVWFWLTLVYVALIIGMPISFAMIAVLGLLDAWFDLRKRFKKI